MADSRFSRISPFLVVATWLVFSVALAAWWVIFAYRFITMAMQNELANVADLAAKQRMLVYEGISLILCLVAGGVALAYYIVREHQRNAQIRQFFAAFTHELKTPIASLRIQAESLAEDLAAKGQAVLAKRLLGDTARLELQLENSLFLANLDALATLHPERVSLERLVDRALAAWPELEGECGAKALVEADPRALEIILKNLASNSLVHGRARKFRVEARAGNEGRVLVVVGDDGTGFQGELTRAGKLFERMSDRGGSGVGLYLVSSLAQKMNGKVTFANREGGRGFVVTFDFPGRIA